MDFVRRITSSVSYRSSFLPRRLLVVLFLVLNGIVILLSFSSYEPTRRWAVDHTQYIKEQGSLLSG